MRFRFVLLPIIVVSAAAAEGLLEGVVGTRRLNHDKSTMTAEELLKISKTGPHSLRMEFISAGKADSDR